MKHFFHILCAVLLTGVVSAQTGEARNNTDQQPLYTSSKLVVGIVVDQMRYDYLTRFWNRFGDEGFKRLINDGFNCKNNHFSYIPTYTGPGHASVYTGAAPQTHGIIGNNWYDKFEEESVYCAGDPEAEPVGTSSAAGKMSPHRMLTTSIADENRLHTQMKGKTIGVALKDRGSILPAGHTANGAYWFHGEDEGKWITSSYYTQNLPQWVEKFNNSGRAGSYFQTWNTLYDIETYLESGDDENQFEGGFRGKETTGFPYDLEGLKEANKEYDIIKNTPFGNSLTTDFAIAAIEGESLGQDDITDFLTVSYSSPDYIGHNFGVNSKEIQDTYLRLDQEMARLLTSLDEKVGVGNYTLFLTSDHGGVHVPSYLESVNIPSGYFEHENFVNSLKQYVSEKFGAGELIQDVSNNQVFFNYNSLLEQDISSEDLQKAVAQFSLQFDRVNMVYTRAQLEGATFTRGVAELIDNGYHQKRSGDVVLVLEPSVITYSRTGSTHGSGQNYDTHAPLIFYGNGIKKGSTTERTEITDIAPTLSALLGIPFPNGSTGKPLGMVIEE